MKEVGSSSVTAVGYNIRIDLERPKTFSWSKFLKINWTNIFLHVDLFIAFSNIYIYIYNGRPLDNQLSKSRGYLPSQVWHIGPYSHQSGKFLPSNELCFVVGAFDDWWRQHFFKNFRPNVTIAISNTCSRAFSVGESNPELLDNALVFRRICLIG